VSFRRQKAGIFVADWRNFDAARAQLAKASGFTFLIFHGHEGDHEPSGYGAVPALWLKEWRGAGLVLGTFGTFGPDDDPVRCATAAAACIRQQRAAFYVANIEVAYPDLVFLRAFRRFQPEIPLWLSSMLDDPRDWGAWFRRFTYKPADCWSPQCYMNQHSGWTPAEAEFKGVNQHGIERGRVKPTFGFGWGSAVPAVDYVSAFRQSGLPPGFTVWREGITDATIIWLGRAIREQRIALI
jgi:hypothetical protein